MYNARKMISNAGNDSILFAHHAADLLNTDQSEEAVSVCEEGVKRFPFYAEGHYVLARCYQTLDRQDEAIAEFERTLFYSPGHLKALKALAYLYYKSKLRAKGNEVLLRMAAYDPLNDELFDFLRSENLLQVPVETAPEVIEPVTEPVASDETSLDFDPGLTMDTEPLAEAEQASEPERSTLDDTVLGELQSVLEDEPVALPAEPENLELNVDLPESLSEKVPVDESETIELPPPMPEPDMVQDELAVPEFEQAQPVSEIPVEDLAESETEAAGPESELPAEEPLFEEEPQAEEDLAEQPKVVPGHEEVPMLEEEAETTPPAEVPTPDEIESVVDELFTEAEPAVELSPAQEGGSLALEDITDLTAEDDQKRADFERNSIDENIRENEAFSKPLDLEQFNNTEDDFSTLIEGYFQEPETEVTFSDESKSEQQEPEQPVEERSFLDTSVIFREKRSEDQEQTAEEALPPKVVEDMNKVADEIEMMSTQVTFKVENEIEKAVETPEPQAPKPETPADSGGLDDVIERLDKARMPRHKTEQPTPAALPDLSADEEVNIDDILKNPTLLTPTFGEILIAQKKFKDAREVFNALAQREPDNKRFRKKIDFLDKIVAMQ